MRPWFPQALVAVAVGLLLCGIAARAETAPATNPVASTLATAQQEAFRAAAAKIAPCLVTIETVGGTQPVAQGAGRRAAPGFIIADGPTTGLIYSPDGLIITSAFNFVRNPSTITVALADGRRFVGELLARDEVRQLAMLKIDAKGLPAPAWCEQGHVRVGQWALALGRGFGGSDPSITAGIVSGLNRQAGLAVQTDAKLSPANFGGPLVDLDGRVIGIAVPMGMGGDAMAGVELYDSGIGFVIPGWQIERVGKDLALGHSLRRGLLGVSIDAKHVTSGPEGRRAEGALRISGVAEPSPAQRAGLQKDDLIIAIEGRPVHEYPEMQRLMRSRLAGERVTVRIRRGAEELEVRVVLGVPEDMGKIPGPATEPASQRGEAK